MANGSSAGLITRPANVRIKFLLETKQSGLVCAIGKVYFRIHDRQTPFYLPGVARVGVSSLTRPMVCAKLKNREFLNQTDKQTSRLSN